MWLNKIVPYLLGSPDQEILLYKAISLVETNQFEEADLILKLFTKGSLHLKTKHYGMLF